MTFLVQFMASPEDNDYTLLRTTHPYHFNFFIMNLLEYLGKYKTRILGTDSDSDPHQGALCCSRFPLYNFILSIRNILFKIVVLINQLLKVLLTLSLFFFQKIKKISQKSIISFNGDSIGTSYFAKLLWLIPVYGIYQASIAGSRKEKKKKHSPK